MSIIRRIDIANEYKISSGTVTRWIELAQEGRNHLQLTMVKDKHQVLDNPNNRAELQKLKDEGNKFKSHIHSVSVKPANEFYRIFNDKQIIEIINYLRTKFILPHKYEYLNGGADIWDHAINEGKSTQTYKTAAIDEELLSEFLEYLLYKTSEYEKLNIVDIGPGNSEIIRPFLEKLAERDKLNKYVGLDISPEMLKLSTSNVKSWFPNIKVDSYLCDIEQSDFAEMLAKNKDDDEVNICILLGGTLGNFEDRLHTLRNMRKSLDNEDLLVFTNPIANQTYQSKHINLKRFKELALWIPALIGIDTDNSEIVTRYDEHRDAICMYLKLDKDYNIEFNLEVKTLNISLPKGADILVYSQHPSTLDEVMSDLKMSSLQLIQLITQKNLTHLLAVAQAAKN